MPDQCWWPIQLFQQLICLCRSVFHSCSSFLCAASRHHSYDFCSAGRIAQHPVQMSVQGAVRLFSPVSYGIGAILPLEIFQQEVFLIFTVFADTPSADKVFISFDLKNRPTAAVIVPSTEAIAHILPQPLEQPFFSIRLTYVENIGGGNALCLQSFDGIGGAGVIVNGNISFFL